MQRYSCLRSINDKLIMGENIGSDEKKNAISIFMNGIDSETVILKYKKSMRAHDDAKFMYPNFFIPPYNEKKKMRLIQGYLPKTNILYANHFELEIIRLLALFDCESITVQQMIDKTIDRLKKTCFGNSCTKGECLATGICVLRFLAAIKPDEKAWIDKILNPLGDVFLSFGNGQASTQDGIPMSYMLMALTDINNDKAKDLIYQKREWLLTLLRKGWITGKLSNGKISEGDTYNLLGKYIIRNALGILPEFSNITKHRIYISEADDRCYCDI